MNEQKEKSPLVEFKEESVQLRNELESEKDEHKKRILQIKLNSANFWVRLMEGLIFVLLITLLLGGCAKMLEGSGRIIEGMGDGIVYAGEHLQESSSSKD